MASPLGYICFIKVTLEQTAPQYDDEHTIHLLHGNLSKDVQVRPVENPPEDAIQARVVRIKQSLIGYSVRHKPHSKEEEEEEDILHLNSKKELPSINPNMIQNMSFRARTVLTIFPTIMIFGPSCL